MNSKTLLLCIALLAPRAINAQTSTSSTPAASTQPVTPTSLDDNPAFKKLSPEQQAWVREMTERLNKAMAQKDTAAIDQIAKEADDHLKQIGAPALPVKYTYQQTAPSNNAPTNNVQAPKPQPPQSGCVAEPAKKPRFHLPKKIQDAINRQAKQIGDKTGIEIDPNAPAQTIKDAQNKPCPPNQPPAPKPANQ